MAFPLIPAAADVVAAGWLSHLPTVVYNVLLVLIGVNLLIIVHEFGHFIVARMCGVKCEKFYIWFDVYGWRFFRFRWGDTEYGLGVLPLGGYVKMLGQEDNPGAIRAEIERAKAVAADTNNKPETHAETNHESQQSELQQPVTQNNNLSVEELEKALYAKDSYLSKRVPQRMAIIVAGVVMNVIFAFICATGAYRFGVEEISPIIGNTAAGSNAWEAGLLPGDTVLAIDNHRIQKFSDITQAIVRSSSEKSTFRIQRLGTDLPFDVEVAPKMGKKALVASFGVKVSNSLKLADKPFYSYLKKTVEKNAEMQKLKGKETLLKVNGQEVSSYSDLEQILVKSPRDSATFTFQKEKSDETVDVTLPPLPWNTLGLLFQTGEITMVLEQGKAFGFEVGDRLLTLNGAPIDPLMLTQQVLEKSLVGGGEMKIAVERKGTQKELTVNIPAEQWDYHLEWNAAAQICSDILGISLTVLPEIVGGNEDIPAGSTLEKIIFLEQENQGLPEILLQSKLGKKVKGGYEIVNNDSLPNIIPNFIMFLEGVLLQGLPTETKIRLTLKSGEKTIETVVPIVTDSRRISTDYGFDFTPILFLDKADNFNQAVQKGWHATVDNTLLVYYTLKQLLRNFNGTAHVSPKGLGGPVMIVQAAYSFASSGMGKYLLFLCMFSANLAVLNILPIPVLDGGHFVFLLYEAVFRKPPNETVQVILSYLGLILLLALMLWVCLLDLGIIKRF
ncbi:MAG: site-2 protease family protein [Planctomycetaceae bacterium]|jgi:regulator of sigma E protease|nr:site-2 protease family protein [Planctomycetaceae bacterium]